MRNYRLSGQPLILLKSTMILLRADSNHKLQAMMILCVLELLFPNAAGIKSLSRVCVMLDCYIIKSLHHVDFKSMVTPYHA